MRQEQARKVTNLSLHGNEYTKQKRAMADSEMKFKLQKPIGISPSLSVPTTPTKSITGRNDKLKEELTK